MRDGYWQVSADTEARARALAAAAHERVFQDVVARKIPVREALKQRAIACATDWQGESRETRDLAINFLGMIAPLLQRIDTHPPR